MNGIPVALGTALFGTGIPIKDSFTVLDQYASLGGRMFDTANSYAYWYPGGKGGESESVLGKWLEGKDRSRFTVMTKIGSQRISFEGDAGILEGLSPDAVEKAVGKSLVRLKTDHIDILLAHHDDKKAPLLDSWSVFSDLVRTGKALKVGVSNYSVERMIELARFIKEHSLAPVDVVQLQYSVVAPVEGTDFGMLVRLDDRMKMTLVEFFPGAKVFAYSPLVGGRIFETQGMSEWPVSYATPENREKVEVLRRQAETLGVSPSALVLRNIADQGIIPITATKNAARLRENLKLFTV